VINKYTKNIYVIIVTPLCTTGNETTAELALFYDYECVKSCTTEIVCNVSALKIHMSENAHDAIAAFPEFITECRGEISVKVIHIFYKNVSCCRQTARCSVLFRNVLTHKTASPNIAKYHVINVYVALITRK